MPGTKHPDGAKWCGRCPWACPKGHLCPLNEERCRKFTIVLRNVQAEQEAQIGMELDLKGYFQVLWKRRFHIAILLVCAVLESW